MEVEDNSLSSHSPVSMISSQPGPPSCFLSATTDKFWEIISPTSTVSTPENQYTSTIVQYTPFSLADSGALPVRKKMCFRARDRDVTSNQKDASGFGDLLNAFHCPPYLPVAASFGVDESL